MGRPRKSAQSTAAPGAESLRKTARAARSGAIPPDKAKKETPQELRLKNWNYTATPISEEEKSKNGRFKGRVLVSWSRPRAMEKFLLHLFYECQARRIDLPLAQICHRFHPGMTPNALKQRLDKLRKVVIAEGHLVPPELGSSISKGERVVRGLVRANRDLQKGDITTTRPVYYDEAWDDPLEILQDAHNLVHNGTARGRAAAAEVEVKIDPDFQSDGEEAAFGIDGDSELELKETDAINPSPPAERARSHMSTMRRKRTHSLDNGYEDSGHCDDNKEDWTRQSKRLRVDGDHPSPAVPDWLSKVVIPQLPPSTPYMVGPHGIFIPYDPQAFFASGTIHSTPAQGHGQDRGRSHYSNHGHTAHANTAAPVAHGENVNIPPIPDVIPKIETEMAGHRMRSTRLSAQATGYNMSGQAPLPQHNTLNQNILGGKDVLRRQNRCHQARGFNQGSEFCQATEFFHLTAEDDGFNMGNSLSIPPPSPLRNRKAVGQDTIVVAQEDQQAHGVPASYADWGEVIDNARIPGSTVEDPATRATVSRQPNILQRPASSGTPSLGRTSPDFELRDTPSEGSVDFLRYALPDEPDEFQAMLMQTSANGEREGKGDVEYDPGDDNFFPPLY